MTDAEKIIQALRCCSGSQDRCGECPYRDVLKNGHICFVQLRLDAADLIERQINTNPNF